MVAAYGHGSLPRLRGRAGVGANARGPLPANVDASRWIDDEGVSGLSCPVIPANAGTLPPSQPSPAYGGRGGAGISSFRKMAALRIPLPPPLAGEGWGGGQRRSPLPRTWMHRAGMTMTGFPDCPAPSFRRTLEPCPPSQPSPARGGRSGARISPAAYGCSSLPRTRGKGRKRRRVTSRLPGRLCFHSRLEPNTDDRRHAGTDPAP